MTLVIGCGNLLRGDDAAGPVAVRRLLERGLPEGVEAVEGGNGIDVALRMRGAGRVVLIDATSSGGVAGTVHRLRGEDVEAMPQPDPLDLHGYRWDQALALARVLLHDDYPAEVIVYLIEAAGFELGEQLSDEVSAAVDELVDRLVAGELAGRP